MKMAIPAPVFSPKLFSPKLVEDEAAIRRYGLILDEFDWMYFFRDIFEGSKTVVIVGKRGAGKTALGLRLGELAKGFFARDVWTNLENTPFKTARDITKIPNGSFAVIDEAELTFHARRAMRNINVQAANIIAISRHKGLSLIFITQAGALIDKLIRSQADYIFLKEPAALQMHLEHDAFSDFVNYALLFFANLPKSERPKYFVTWKDDYFKYLLAKYSKYLQYYTQSYFTWLLRRFAIIKCKNSLPSFWTDRISKSFASWGHEEHYKKDPFYEHLCQIAQNDGGKLTIKQICKSVKLSQRSVYRKINKLIEAGLIERVKPGVYRLKSAKLS